MLKMKRLSAAIMAAVTLLSCFTLAVGAKNVCSEISGKTDYDGGVNTVFYVTAKDTKKHYVKMEMTKGCLVGKDNFADWTILWWGQERIYDYYEILVYGRQSNGSYKQISKANVRDESSYKIYFSGYTDYKIKVYSWRAQTINDEAAYIREPIRRNRPQDVYWDKIPTWKISKTSGVTLCR